ncbi:jg13558 [Pararge aegeria aegeria]|uniref:Jg13558 protein n=1 Tax=Pararge aegeria aegeria TaxID=348720 RepID=A0A8S4S5A3_9NEOP|nr:jg13558 [Pararge aegeria aegeria]
MERAMLEECLCDKITNEMIYRIIRVTNIAYRVTKLNWQWAGRLAEPRGFQGARVTTPHFKLSVGRGPHEVDRQHRIS